MASSWLHQLQVPRHVRVGLGGADPLGAHHDLDPSSAHQSGDLVATDVVTGALGGLLDLLRAVEPVVVRPQAPQHRTQHGLTLRNWRPS